MLRTSIFLIIAMVSLASTALPPPERSYKILMLLPVSSKSHRNVFMPLANALADRGHKVTMLSHHNLDNPKIEHFRHGVRRFDVDSLNMFEIGRNPSKMFEFFDREFPLIASEIYDDPIVKDLYAKRKDFDLLIINQMFNDIMYPFAYEQKFITIATGGIDPGHSAIIGNLMNPAYVTNVLDNYPQPFSFINRVKNLFFSVAVPIQFKGKTSGPAQKEVSKRFPELPSLRTIEANQSLSLLNHHFSLAQSIPLLPGQVEIGGMHCRPAKSLPKDMADFLAGTTPVVYMSLGSVARSETIPKEYQQILRNTFSKLPYKVLWKYEDENVKGLPKNVMIKKWMPQQDILAHPNVKIFITHCGGLGVQEAMYHATPMLGLPIFGDQPKNGKGFTFAGLGRVIQWEELTEDKLTEGIHDVIQNPEYQKKIARVSAAFKDQLETPTERAVFWTEYVIRHDGAPHLKSPELDLSIIELLHLDILLVLHILLYLVCRFVRRIYCYLTGGSKTKSRKSKRE